MITILKTSQATQDLIFGTADVEKMRLKGANLGIGTTDPKELLDISAGRIRLDNQQGLCWSTDDNNIGRVQIFGNESDDTIIFRTDNATRLTIGAGTTTFAGTTEMNWGGAYNDTSMANFKSVNNAGFYIRSYYAGGIGVAMNPITGGGVGGGRLVLASHYYNYYLLEVFRNRI